MGTPPDYYEAEAYRKLQEWNHKPGFYCGWKDDDATLPPIVWMPHGEPLPLEPSLAIRPLSPSGFSWGDDGSGSSQLALALLFHFTGNDRRALATYQDFKRAYVARWSDTWELDPAALEGWLIEREAQR